jgi:hypothetical protein
MMAIRRKVLKFSLYDWYYHSGDRFVFRSETTVEVRFGEYHSFLASLISKTRFIRKSSISGIRTGVSGKERILSRVLGRQEKCRLQRRLRENPVQVRI